MYAITLFVHSWLRWILLAAGTAVIARAVHARYRARPWSPADERVGRVWIHLLNLQFLLGLLLYAWLSPIVRGGLADLSAAMKSSVLRFYAVEHITAMFIAVGVAHAGWARARRAKSDAARHRGTAIAAGLWLLCVIIGIPWPFRPYGRPLARVSLETELRADRSSLYSRRCAACHGERLDGHGLASGSMSPPPRDFRDAAWQRTVTNDDLQAVILQGGPARGLSANMPAHPDLTEAQVAELLSAIRRAEGGAAPEP